MKKSNNIRNANELGTTKLIISDNMEGNTHFRILIIELFN